MALKNQYAMIDGLQPSFADLNTSFSPSPIQMAAGAAGLAGLGSFLAMSDLFSINTGRTLEISDVGGAGGRKQMGTTGMSNSTASLVFWRSGYQNFLRKLMAQAQQYRRGRQVPIGLVKFNIDYQFKPPGSIEIYQRIVRGARVAGDEMNIEEGPDGQKVSVPLWVTEVVDIIDGQEVVLL